MGDESGELFGFLFGGEVSAEPLSLDGKFAVDEALSLLGEEFPFDADGFDFHLQLFAGANDAMKFNLVKRSDCVEGARGCDGGGTYAAPAALGEGFDEDDTRDDWVSREVTFKEEVLFRKRPRPGDMLSIGGGVVLIDKKKRGAMR